jgi:hypothetical protein
MQLLGRSNHPEQFIKRGCGQAEISIELQQNSGPTLTIRREIKHGQPGSNLRSTSEYFINGASSKSSSRSYVSDTLNARF